VTSDPQNIQHQFEGYLNTPLLWIYEPLLELRQLELQKFKVNPFNESIPFSMLLGKRVERFVHHELVAHDDIQILLENVQVQDQKITLGEIDCIILQDNVPTHIEIIYKFYIYDPAAGVTELDHWIGPNRKDSLIKKLNKLKKNQLPLVHHRNAQPILQEFHIDITALRQRVIFKAQLFVPYKSKSIEFDLLNPECLKGFYVSHNELREFKHCTFFIPDKVDWLIEAHPNVSWLPYDVFQEKVGMQIRKKRSPLCWMTLPDGKLQKFFVIWWA